MTSISSNLGQTPVSQIGDNVNEMEKGQLGDRHVSVLSKTSHVDGAAVCGGCCSAVLIPTIVAASLALSATLYTGISLWALGSNQIGCQYNSADGTYINNCDDVVAEGQKLVTIAGSIIGAVSVITGFCSGYLKASE